MNRRQFMQGILLAGIAPAFVRAESLMKGIGFSVPVKEIIVPSRELIVPSMAKGLRIFTAQFDSMAALEAEAEGLKVLRDYVSYGGQRLVDFELEKPTPYQHYRKIVL